jgi:CDP-diacylglycerol---glycerol-3-phosphate 3-phosphatidyltransferase
MVASFRFYLPNVLTILRIAVTPFIVASLFYAEWIIVGLVLFCTAMLSDYYDGYYARKFEVVSKLGIFLDPLADKVLVLSLFGAFCVKAVMAWWMFGLIVVRELMVTVLRMIMIQYGFILKTSQSGKIKVVVQFFVLYMLFFQQILGCNPSWWKVYGFWVDGLVFVSIYAALAMTVFSGLQYLYDNRDFFKVSFGFFK